MLVTCALTVFMLRRTRYTRSVVAFFECLTIFQLELIITICEISMGNLKLTNFPRIVNQGDFVKEPKAIVFAAVLMTLVIAAAAVDIIEDDLGLNEPTAEDYKDRAIAADAKGEYAKAITYYDKSLELNPNDGTVWHYKAQTYKEMGKYKEAVECYEKTLEFYDAVLLMSPFDGETWWMKGNALKKLGKYGRANDCFENAKEFGYEPGDE